MTYCRIEAEVYIDDGYTNGLKRISIEFGDYDESFMLRRYEACELAEAIESIIGKDPYDPDRGNGLDFFQNGDILGVYPSGWNVALRINGVEAEIEPYDAKRLINELMPEASKEAEE